MCSAAFGLQSDRKLHTLNFWKIWKFYNFLEERVLSKLKKGNLLVHKQSLLIAIKKTVVKNIY